MKLFIATIALAKAQDVADAGDDARTFSFGDSAFDSYGSYGDSTFGSAAFYDSAYGSDYGDLSAVYDGNDAAAAADADAAVADEAGRDKDEARYFGTTAAQVTTTTTPPTTTTHDADTFCLKCDVMTPADCVSSSGVIQGCDHGDVCFLEVRRNNPRAPSNTAVTQICTGCKDAQACFDLKDQNAVVGSNRFRDLMQCYPMHAAAANRPRLGEMASVCRTCFIPSSTNAVKTSVNFLTGTSGNHASFTIPNGTGTPTTFTLYPASPNQAAYESFWFTEDHGLTEATHGLDFSIAYPA